MRERERNTDLVVEEGVLCRHADRDAGQSAEEAAPLSGDLIKQLMQAYSEIAIASGIVVRIWSDRSYAQATCLQLPSASDALLHKADVTHSDLSCLQFCQRYGEPIKQVKPTKHSVKAV